MLGWVLNLDFAGSPAPPAVIALYITASGDLLLVPAESGDLLLVPAGASDEVHP